MCVIICYYLLRKISFLKKSVEFELKSLSVRHGKCFENFVPFTSEFEKIGNKDNFVFIGKPIDGVIFDDEAIKFVEIKTGKGDLNKKQKWIKNLVEKKKVEWYELRY